MYNDILSNLIINEIYSALTVYTEKGKKSKRLCRKNWAMLMKYEGETTYFANGKSYISNANNIILLPKGCSYEWNCNEAGHFITVEFESGITCEDVLSCPVKNGGKILNLLKDIEYKRMTKPPMYNIENICNIYSILLLLEQNSKKYVSHRKTDKIAPALEYIAKNYNKKIKNDELAEVCGISCVYFRKIFSEVIGSSPINHVHEIRIQKAKEMLKSDYGNITDIALSLGYSDVYDFSRVFKKIVGVPPSKY